MRICVCGCVSAGALDMEFGMLFRVDRESIINGGTFFLGALVT